MASPTTRKEGVGAHSLPYRFGQFDKQHPLEGLYRTGSTLTPIETQSEGDNLVEHAPLLPQDHRHRELSQEERKRVQEKNAPSKKPS